MRDSHFCGVQYGVFDIHQLHRSMVNVGHDDEQELMIDPDGVHALEQFVMAKYYLTTNVYRHRVRLVTDQMIVRAIVLGIEVDQLDDLRAIYTFDNCEAFFRRYTAQDDARFMFQFDLSAKPGTRCGDLLARLQRRQLHKRVFTARIEEFGDPQLRPTLQDISKPSSAPLRKSVEERLSVVLGEQFQCTIDPHDVIVHGFDIKSVRTTSRNDEGAIMIDRRPQPIPFDQDSTLFASIDEGHAEASIEVYAPVALETSTERGRFSKALREPIQEAISVAVREEIQKGDNP